MYLYNKRARDQRDQTTRYWRLLRSGSYWFITYCRDLAKNTWQTKPWTRPIVALHPHVMGNEVQGLTSLFHLTASTFKLNHVFVFTVVHGRVIGDSVGHRCRRVFGLSVDPLRVVPAAVSVNYDKLHGVKGAHIWSRGHCRADVV